MSTRYKIFDPAAAYFLTLTVVGWIDLFTRKAYKDILIESLEYCQNNKGLIIYGFVIMSNHLHLIAQAGGEIPLQDILRDYKKYTSRQLVKAVQSPKESRRQWLLHQFKYYARINRRDHTYQVWQPDNHPFHVHTPKIIWQKLGYIHLNPVKAGIVRTPEHYLYSSASNYMDGTGVLQVEMVDLGGTEGYIYLGY